MKEKHLVPERKATVFEPVVEGRSAVESLLPWRAHVDYDFATLHLRSETVPYSRINYWCYAKDAF